MVDYKGLSDMIDSEKDNMFFNDKSNYEEIKRAEERMGKMLPDTYKWWLTNFGGGEVFYSEIKGVYGDGIMDDIASDYIKSINIGYAEEDEIIILDDMDLEDLFYFKTTDITDCIGNEYAVYSFRHGNTKYADNFVEFLKKLILERKEEWDVR